MRQVCPSCSEVICPPSGHSSDLLIIGEFPGDEEMRRGFPFATNLNYITAGKVFRSELGMEPYPMQLAEFRVTNLWLHQPNDNENCRDAGYKQVLEEAKGKKAILLVGSDVVSAFTNYKVSEITGLRVESSILSAPLIVAMVNPALALHRTVGEVRFAIQQWKKYLKEEGLI